MSIQEGQSREHRHHCIHDIKQKQTQVNSERNQQINTFGSNGPTFINIDFALLYD